jgi:hypothetical protein
VIDDESNNTESGTGTSDQAVSKGEERAGSVRHFLRRRHQVHSRGTNRFSIVAVFLASWAYCGSAEPR